MASKITITFDAEPALHEYISFDIVKKSGLEPAITHYESFELTRTTNGEITMPTVFYVPTGTASAEAYENAFNIDYNGFSLFTVSRLINVVTIEFQEDIWDFETYTSNNANVTAVIANTGISTFELVSSVISANTDQCNYFDVEITATEAIEWVITNGTRASWDTPNVVKSFGRIRGVDVNIQIEDVNGVVIDVDDYAYDKLASDNITVNIANYITGATLSVIVENVDGLELEYSLDNVNWQTSNIFTGQAVGTAFLYVRDQFLCVKSKEYTVTEFGTRDPYSYFSDANSISFSKYEVWDGCSIFKNDENTLDCQGLSQYNSTTSILFQTCDTTTIQLKSNFDTITGVIIDSNDSETSITITKKSSNLNRFKSLDASYYNYREGKLGVFFDSGDTYDEYGSSIGTHALSGNLPEFAIIGQEISIEGLGTFTIKDVLYDDVPNKRIIVVDYTFSGSETTAVVSSIYDILSYEIYEFAIDWSSFSVGEYTLQITNSDETNDTVIYNSEKILLAVEHEDTLAIAYSNNNNRDVFYKYGIEHFIRMPFVKFISKPKDDSEINITDNNAVVVESTVYKAYEILFDVASNSLMEKLVVALSCENLYINGIGYVKDGNVNVENIENNNLHEVTVNLIKTNISYNNFSQGQSGSSESDIDTEITLITTGTNFIKA